jgi:hypothetical protein
MAPMQPGFRFRNFLTCSKEWWSDDSAARFGLEGPTRVDAETGEQKSGSIMF